jgi:hypothetical protein
LRPALKPLRPLQEFQALLYHRLSQLVAAGLRALRDAVRATMNDEDFLAEARTLEIDVAPMGADETAALVERLFATPSATVAGIEAAPAQ